MFKITLPFLILMITRFWQMQWVKLFTCSSQEICSLEKKEIKTPHYLTFYCQLFSTQVHCKALSSVSLNTTFLLSWV